MKAVYRSILGRILSVDAYYRWEEDKGANLQGQFSE